jgi:hypothetical protein
MNSTSVISEFGPARIRRILVKYAEFVNPAFHCLVSKFKNPCALRLGVELDKEAKTLRGVVSGCRVLGWLLVVCVRVVFLYSCYVW